MPDPGEAPPEVPEDEGEIGGANGSSALDFLQQRFEAIDAEDAPDYGKLLAESEVDDRLAEAMGEVARNPEAVEQLLSKSRLSPRGQQVAQDMLSNFTGSGSTPEPGE